MTNNYGFFRFGGMLVAIIHHIPLDLIPTTLQYSYKNLTVDGHLSDEPMMDDKNRIG
ncbi:MAG: hypothetical protein WCE81_08495 [Halobacteriota archaeon]